MSLACIHLTVPLPLYSAAATREIEQAAAAAMPAHTLMQRAGLAVARLACAIAPHARVIWLACGRGNNGGDGLEAAMHLRLWGREPVVTWAGDEASCPPDALASLHRAREAGVLFATSPPAHWDVAVDALLGIGFGRGRGFQSAAEGGRGVNDGSKAGDAAVASGTVSVRRAPDGVLADWLARMLGSGKPVLHVDLPSGLSADTGVLTQLASDLQVTIHSIAPHAYSMPATDQFGLKNKYTLSLLTLKPGLFTAQGRDACGEIWFDDLGLAQAVREPSAWLLSASEMQAPPRLHASHKGSYGDVAVIGGAKGMQGAALLAARAALHAGAGRVFVSLLGGGMTVDPMQPELMFREMSSLDLAGQTVVCGCGGGDEVRRVLPRVLSMSQRLILDADALNAIAVDASLERLLQARAAKDQATILTPHPLEAARLLGITSAQVQADRLQAAQTLAERFSCTVILKGSGSIIATGGAAPRINPTGDARLATAGTGDVLAGMCGAFLAQGERTDRPAPLGSDLTSNSRPDSKAHADSHAEATSRAAQRACWVHGRLVDEPAPAASATIFSHVVPASELLKRL